MNKRQREKKAKKQHSFYCLAVDYMHVVRSGLSPKDVFNDREIKIVIKSGILKNIVNKRWINTNAM